MKRHEFVYEDAEIVDAEFELNDATEAPTATAGMKCIVYSCD